LPADLGLAGAGGAGRGLPPALAGRPALRGGAVAGAVPVAVRPRAGAGAAGLGGGRAGGGAEGGREPAGGPGRAVAGAGGAVRGVLALGLVSAVVEELFFRGYLFRGLEALAGPLGVVLATSLLFALFHLWMPGALAAERFVVSLLLGLVLGWVAWRTGSVLPGMLMHGAHNGTLALLAYYEPVLAERGWLVGAQEHLPEAVLVWAGAGAALGALVVWLTGARSPSRPPPGGANDLGWSSPPEDSSTPAPR